MKLKVAFCMVVVAGCSSPATCDVSFQGNTVDEATPATCVTLQQASAGWTFAVDTSSPAIGRFTANIDLGTTPTPGQFTSDTVATWSAEALVNATSCPFTAGATTIPTGSFELTLDSIDTSTGTAHGALALVAYVHAPPLTDCGPGDTEDVLVQF